MSLPPRVSSHRPSLVDPFSRQGIHIHPQDEEMDAQDNLLGVVGVDITYRTYGDDGGMVYGIVLPTLVV